jgi:hypothetical protein
VKQNPHDDDFDPIGALLEAAEEEAGGGEPDPPAPPEDEDDDGGLMADLVASVNEPMDELKARLSIPEPSPPPAPAPAPEPAPGPAPSPPAEPRPAVRPSGAPRIAVVSPAAAPGIDVSKLLRLTLAGCAIGLLWFAAVQFWPEERELTRTYRGRLDRLLSGAEEGLAGENPSANLRQLAKGLVTKDPELMPEILDAAALPARDTWLALLARPGEVRASGQEDQARFRKLSAQLEEVGRTAEGLGLAPPYPLASDPLGCLGDVGSRLAAAPTRLRPPPPWEPPPLKLEGSEAYLLVLRDMAHTISRRQAGDAAQALLDLVPALGWSLDMAPAPALLGTPAPPEGDVSPAALAMALLEVSRARIAASRGRVEVPLMHQAARRLLPGFPASPDAFGGAWTRVACELYALTGHDALVTRAARAYAERAAAVTGGAEHARRVVAGLLTLLGEKAPEDLGKLWSELHGGTPPEPPGKWWSNRPPLRRALNGLAGILPDQDRLEGVGQGGPSARERKQRYRRFQRRRGKRKPPRS